LRIFCDLIGLVGVRQAGHNPFQHATQAALDDIKHDYDRKWVEVSTTLPSKINLLKSQLVSRKLTFDLTVSTVPLPSKVGTT